MRKSSVDSLILSLLPQSAQFLYFKGRIELMKGNIDEVNIHESCDSHVTCHETHVLVQYVHDMYPYITYCVMETCTYTCNICVHTHIPHTCIPRGVMIT